MICNGTDFFKIWNAAILSAEGIVVGYSGVTLNDRFTDPLVYMLIITNENK